VPTNKHAPRLCVVTSDDPADVREAKLATAERTGDPILDVDCTSRARWRYEITCRYSSPPRRIADSPRGENQPPSAVILLPSNGREPIDDIDEPLPRVRRTGAAAIVIYDPAMGQPTPEAIRQLIDGMVTP